MKLLPIILILLLTSCKAIKEAREERKERKVVEWNLLHPEKSAEWCADHYPCIGDSVIVKDSILIDTIYQDGVLIDTFYLKNLDTVWIRAKCPPHQVITKTEKQTVYVSVIDSARATSYLLQGVRLQKELVLVATERDEWKVKARSRMWMFIAACSLILGLIAVIVAILKGKNKTKVLR
jgi:hypothetical protein